MAMKKPRVNRPLMGMSSGAGRVKAERVGTAANGGMLAGYGNKFLTGANHRKPVTASGFQKLC